MIIIIKKINFILIKMKRIITLYFEKIFSGEFLIICSDKILVV